MTDLVLRLLEALYSLPGLATLGKLALGVITALLPSGVSVTDAAIFIARLSWYAVQVIAAAVVIGAVTAVAYVVTRATAYVIDRVGARNPSTR